MQRMPSLLESRRRLLHFRASLERKWIQPKFFTNGDWMLSQSRTTSSKGNDFVVLGTAKLRHRNSISWPTMRGGDVLKRNLMEFTIASNEIQHIVIRNSKMAGLRRSASRWTKLAQENHSYCPSSEEYERFKKKLVYLTEQVRQKCTDETPIRLPRSTNKYAPSPPWIWRTATWTNSSLSIPKVAFLVFFMKYLMVAVEWTLVEFTTHFWKICGKIVYSW